MVTNASCLPCFSPLSPTALIPLPSPVVIPHPSPKFLTVEILETPQSHTEQLWPFSVSAEVIPLLSALTLPTKGDYLEPNISHPLSALISTCLSLPQDFNHFHFCLIPCHINSFCLLPFLVRIVEFLFLPATGMSHASPAHCPAPRGLPVSPHADFAFFPSPNSSSSLIPVHVSHLLVRLLAVQGD